MRSWELFPSGMENSYIVTGAWNVSYNDLGVTILSCDPRNYYQVAWKYSYIITGAWNFYHYDLVVTTENILHRPLSVVIITYRMRPYVNFTEFSSFLLTV